MQTSNPNSQTPKPKSRIKNHESRFAVIGCGALNMDYLFEVDELVTDGETFAKSSRREPGGSAANTIYALAKLGVPCGFLGSVGDDEDGQALLDSFRSVSVDVSGITIKQGIPTGRVMGFVDAHGKRALYVSPGANLELAPEDFKADYVCSAQLLHCSSLVGEAQMQMQQRLVESLPADVKFSFAPGAIYARRGLEALLPFLHRAEVLFVSKSELEMLTGVSDTQTGAKRILDAGVKLAAVTLGEEGSFVMDGRTEDFHHPLPVRVVDTTGSGDAFAAGFLFGCLHELPLNQCHHLAAVMASLCVAQWGARSGLPTLAELQEKSGLSLPALTGSK